MSAGPASREGACDGEVEELLDSIRRAKGRLRELLVERETQLRMAARLASVGAWRVVLAPLRFLPSAEWLRLLAQGTDGAVSLTGALRLFPRPARRTLLAHVRDGLRGHAGFDLVVPARTLAGERIHLRLIAEPEFDATGALAALHGACQDVTEQVAREREATGLALRLANTVESITDGLLSLDRDWRVTYVNAAAERILRCRREPMAGQVLWQVFPHAVGGVFHHECEQALAENRPRVFQSFLEGLGIWLEVRAYPTGQGLAVYFTDVTQQRLLQEELARHQRGLEQLVQERTQELRNANDELAAFTMAVAHDLRAPLAAIEGFSRALQERLPAHDDRAQHYADRTAAGVERMGDMIDALLALSRVGQTPLERRPIDLSALAAEVVEQLRAADPLRQIKVEITPGLQASADPRLLRTVLENLLGNAWKFTRRTAGARIRFGLAGDGAFCVADNGAGFDLAYAHKLFTPFQRFHAQEDFPGTGVGLAAVRRVIQRHGGTISAESAAGEGATFHFTLAPAG
ncbi:PAS domain-containing protein [Ramlibacter sp. G-1-2-2]|uniref:histidine kinase n=1 Tax=Ramlibacter agri TaxID=2728837 RepID=A0A848HEB5_9BURK|nr:ATP-binding protein [Ramlibacter agri]NML47829.1 PAS domain-containing protein [Ramlibacter agri]